MNLEEWRGYHHKEELNDPADLTDEQRAALRIARDKGYPINGASFKRSWEANEARKQAMNERIAKLRGE